MSTTSSTSSLSNTNSALDYSNILTSVTGSSTTGIDVNAAVTAAIYAARAPERIWQAEQVTLSSQTTALTAIQTATQSLQNDMTTLDNMLGPLASRTVSSSYSSYVTATATAGTAVGTHTVSVNTLATKASWYSDLESSATATLPSSSLTITTASGTTATFATGSGNAGDNLNDLAKAINANTSLGVTATVMSDATGSRLAIVSNSSGVANGFTITSPSYTGTSWTSPTLGSGQTLGAGSITITTSAGTSTITTSANETYAQLATAINNAVIDGTSTPLGLTATATTNADGSTSLSVSGSGSSFTISQPEFGFTQSASAKNATGAIDGVPYTSASNTLTGIVSGVTVNLLAETGGAGVTLTVAPDTTQISNTINQFVTDYNSAINLVNAQFKMTTSTDSSGNTSTSQGVLASDATVRNLQSALEQAMSYVYTPPSGTTTVSMLSDLGITMNNDGTLSVNSTTLNNAITTSPADVQSFFQGTAFNGFANTLYKTINIYTSPANGAFKVDLASIDSTNKSLTKQINDFETGYIANQQTVLTAEFSKAEQALQMMTQTMNQINALLGLNSKGN